MTPKRLGRAAAHENHARWEKFCALLGAGIGGLALFGDIGKDAFSNACYIVRALFITFVVLGGAAVGRAYFGYTMADYRLRVEGITGKEDEETPTDIRKMSGHAHGFFRAAVVFAVLATGALLVAAWWAPDSNP